eukprot:TRINITY_DN12186_c0_g3_i1.p1 TRINITY_DN12186_c0_g3~~TRINITY_DN12186_c0_g3_i1.p1  ORF type:complete len:519 (+),score=90.13 TRINITY_DN12186_c0_g3_i1:79-1557(+)
MGEGIYNLFGWPANMRRFDLEVQVWIRDMDMLVAIPLIYGPSRTPADGNSVFNAAHPGLQGLPEGDKKAVLVVPTPRPNTELLQQHHRKEERHQNQRQEEQQVLKEEQIGISGIDPRAFRNLAGESDKKPNSEQGGIPNKDLNKVPNIERNGRSSEEQGGERNVSVADTDAVMPTSAVQSQCHPMDSLCSKPGDADIPVAEDAEEKHRKKKKAKMGHRQGQAKRGGEDLMRKGEVQEGGVNRNKGKGAIQAVGAWKENGNSVQAKAHHADRQLYARRTYRVALVRTALKPSTAYALLQLAHIEPGHIVLDPMCGGGTIPLEAADWLGSRIAALGGDNDEFAVEAARKNSEALYGRPPPSSEEVGNARWRPLTSGSDLAVWDVCRLPVRTGSIDRLLCDMPFGVRCGSVRMREQLSPRIAREVARVLPPSTGRAILMGQSKAMRHELLTGQKEFLTVEMQLVVDMEGIRVDVFLLQRTATNFVYPPDRSILRG